MSKVEILVAEPMRESLVVGLERVFAVHRLWETADAAGLLGRVGDRIRGLVRFRHPVDSALLRRLPKLEIVGNFGVGYDGIDLGACVDSNIVVTNTPGVLNDETADTAIGLLLMTVRELSSAERYLRAGRWARDGNYPLTRGTLRDRTVGIVGLGRIGLAVARRLDAMNVPVVYHNRRPRTDVAYPYYGSLLAMAEAVDTLMVVLPGTPSTNGLIDASVLAAIGANGVLVNIGRGFVVDMDSLVDALSGRTILAAGLDVYPKEPHVPEALLSLDNVVLLPHVGSASIYTQDAMAALVVDNLRSWFEEGRPLTPVAETPWPPA